MTQLGFSPETRGNAEVKKRSPDFSNKSESGDDIVGPMALKETREHILESEQRAREEGERREAQERKQRTREVLEKYAEQDKQATLLEARKYAKRLKKEADDERAHPERKHERELAVIRRQLSEVISLHEEKKADFWSFLPSRRREWQKLEEQIQELRTRGRVERMRIADITGKRQYDLRGKRIKNALEPFFDTLRKPEKPPLTLKEKQMQQDARRELIRGLYREKASLEAEREGLIMLIRPFRRREIENRLQVLGDEMRVLQEEMRHASADGV